MFFFSENLLQENNSENSYIAKTSVEKSAGSNIVSDKNNMRYLIVCNALYKKDSCFNTH